MGNGMGDILGRFREIRGVSMVALVSMDGLVVESSHAEGLDPAAVAGVASNGLMLAEAVGRQLDLGSARQALIEYEGGLLVLEPLSEDVMVLVLSRDRNDLGRIRFTAAQQRARLQEAVASIG